MKQTAGLILAAGKQTRFDSKRPKFLSNYNGLTVLETNIKYMHKYVDIVFVAISNIFFAEYDSELYSYLNKYENLCFLPFDPGGGCGFTSWKALSMMHNYDSVIMCWGDSIQDNEDIYREFQNYDPKNKILVPCEYVKNPYVSFIVDDDNIIDRVLFSKYGETQAEGWHDLSIFYFDRSFVYYALNLMIYNNIRRDDEIIFLDIFNLIRNAGSIITTNYSSKSFNTIKEYNDVVIGEKK